jgi:malonate-semialdehyde dehydrogenase (acetylating)/methylmalonate-semialdehyde dehydrogenase
VREVALATAAEVDAAVQSAASAFRAWADVPPPRRARVMFRFQELLNQNIKRIARALSEEHGKTLPDAEAEVARGLEVVEFACGAPQLLKGEFSDSVGSGVDS